MNLDDVAKSLIRYSASEQHKYKSPSLTVQIRRNLEIPTVDFETENGDEISLTSPDIGRAHDMFSRIFQNTNLRNFSMKYYVIFLKCSKLRKKYLFWPIVIRNIGEKIRRFVFRKFVKICCELDNRPHRLVGFVRELFQFWLHCGWPV